MVHYHSLSLSLGVSIVCAQITPLQARGGDYQSAGSKSALTLFSISLCMTLR